jgi:hypothetical protein
MDAGGAVSGEGLSEGSNRGVRGHLGIHEDIRGPVPYGGHFELRIGLGEYEEHDAFGDGGEFAHEGHSSSAADGGAHEVDVVLGACDRGANALAALFPIDVKRGSIDGEKRFGEKVISPALVAKEDANHDVEETTRLAASRVGL